MNTYHASFCILGEVTEMKFVKEPVQRMLIDISACPAADFDPSEFVHRTSFSATTPQLIFDLRNQVSPGDIIEAKGAFWQCGYVPLGRGYVDTTFCLSEFRLVGKKANPSARYSPYQSFFSNLDLH